MKSERAGVKQHICRDKLIGKHKPWLGNLAVTQSFIVAAAQVP